jgi:hypothetical protein
VRRVVTPAELADIRQPMEALLLPAHAGRRRDARARPAGSQPVDLVVLAHPVRAAR